MDRTMTSKWTKNQPKNRPEGNRKGTKDFMKALNTELQKEQVLEDTNDFFGEGRNFAITF